MYGHVQRNCFSLYKMKVKKRKGKDEKNTKIYQTNCIRKWKLCQLNAQIKKQEKNSKYGSMLNQKRIVKIFKIANWKRKPKCKEHIKIRLFECKYIAEQQQDELRYCIQEEELDVKIFPNYIVCSTDKTRNKGGGTRILVRNSMCHNPLPTLQPNLLETIAVKKQPTKARSQSEDIGNQNRGSTRSYRRRERKLKPEELCKYFFPNAEKGRIMKAGINEIVEENSIISQTGNHRKMYFVS